MHHYQTIHTFTTLDIEQTVLIQVHLLTYLITVKNSYTCVFALQAMKKKPRKSRKGIKGLENRQI